MLPDFQLQPNTPLARHHMELAIAYPTGAETWLCPTCGRRFVVQWPPVYKRIVLEPGDEKASHYVAKGGVQIGSVDIT